MPMTNLAQLSLQDKVCETEFTSKDGMNSY